MTLKPKRYKRQLQIKLHCRNWTEVLQLGCFLSLYARLEPWLWKAKRNYAIFLPIKQRTPEWTKTQWKYDAGLNNLGVFSLSAIFSNCDIQSVAFWPEAMRVDRSCYCQESGVWTKFRKKIWRPGALKVLNSLGAKCLTKTLQDTKKNKCSRFTAELAWLQDTKCNLSIQTLSETHTCKLQCNIVHTLTVLDEIWEKTQTWQWVGNFC